MTPGRKEAILAICGGFLYILLEVAWRGYSHWSMFLLGGLCFVLIGLLNELLPWEMPLILQGLIGSFGIVTPLEFATGCVVNIWLGWDVWDYSDIPLNIFGQVCLPFSLLWILVSIVAVVLDDWLRWRFFGEAKPQYSFVKWMKGREKK